MYVHQALVVVLVYFVKKHHFEKEIGNGTFGDQTKVREIDTVKAFYHEHLITDSLEVNWVPVFLIEYIKENL